MLIKEYRIVLPLSVEEYQVAQLYSVARASRNETGGGEGIEVIKNEPFDNYPLLGGKYTSGQYTKKIYHFSSKVPGFIRLIAPKGALNIHEEAWNAYPYCKTVVTNPDYMKADFEICIETMHCADRGEQENVHELPEEKLKIREVVNIDIANDLVPTKDYKETEDPKIFTSVETGRGPLGENWKDEADPVMCAYKLVTVNFQWWGFQTKVESFIQNTEQRLFLNFHRQLFCWIDEWCSLNMTDIRDLEDKTKEDLQKQIQDGHVRGTQVDD